MSSISPPRRKNWIRPRSAAMRLGAMAPSLPSMRLPSRLNGPPNAKRPLAQLTTTAEDNALRTAVQDMQGSSAGASGYGPSRETASAPPCVWAPWCRPSPEMQTAQINVTQPHHDNIFASAARGHDLSNRHSRTPLHRSAACNDRLLS
jgi:hypothetical protein